MQVPALWKVLLSRSRFKAVDETIGGRCDWERKVIWINDDYVHTSRMDKVDVGRVRDVFSLDPEQRFIMLLNHEIFHAAWHEKINDLVAAIAIVLVPFFLADVLCLHWIFPRIFPALAILVALSVAIALLYTAEEKLAYEHGENCISIDRKMFARLS